MIIQILRNIGVVLVGFLVGNIVNMSLVKLGHLIYPVSESLNKNGGVVSLEILIFPFLAHLMGTVTAVAIVMLFAASHQRWLSLAIGVTYLCAGIYMAQLMSMIPTWYKLFDVIMAYIPPTCFTIWAVELWQSKKAIKTQNL